MTTLTELLIDALLGGRIGGAWGYRPGAEPSVEVTVLAGLAAAGARSADGREIAADAAEWVSKRQNRDGSVGVSSRLAHPDWNTSLACWLWTALGSHAREANRASAHLIKCKGTTVQQSEPKVFGHDPAILGWPWTEGTHSWVEPTAYAVIALRGLGLSNAERTRSGVRLLLDRALARGGWNYGNPMVYGKPFRPQPDLTGIALLALSGALDRNTPVIQHAIDYLLSALPCVRSPRSLGWGLIGLSAWGADVDQASRWIEESLERNPCTGADLALLTLASEGGLVDLLRLSTSCCEGSS